VLRRIFGREREDIRGGGGGGGKREAQKFGLSLNIIKFLKQKKKKRGG